MLNIKIMRQAIVIRLDDVQNYLKWVNYVNSKLGWILCGSLEIQQQNTVLLYNQI